MGLLGRGVILCLSSWGASSFPQLLHRFTSPPTVHRVAVSPHPHPHLLLLLTVTILLGVRRYVSVVLICISLLLVRLSIFPSAHRPSVDRLWRQVYSSHWPMFQSGFSVLLLLTYRRSPHRTEISPLADIGLHGLHWFFRLLSVLTSNSVKSSKPWTWNVFPFIYGVFNFPQQCFVVFTVWVCHVLC